MQRFSGLWSGELFELQYITREYEAALDRVGWKPDHINYAMLGNFFHEPAGHGHMHIVPRYAPRPTPLTFMRTVFEDDRWGKHYAPATPMEVQRDVLTAIVAVLQDELEKKGQKKKRKKKGAPHIRWGGFSLCPRRKGGQVRHVRHRCLR